MNCARDQLFARATFPGDEHRGLRLRNLGNRLSQLLHWSALAKQTAVAELVAQLLVLRSEPVFIESTSRCHAQLIGGEGLCEVVACSELHALNRRGNRWEGCHQ